MSRALNVGVVQLARVLRPQSIVGGDVEEQAASGDGPLKRSGIAEIAGDGFNGEVVDAATGPHQRSHAMPMFDQDARNMPTKKSAGAGNKCWLHVAHALLRAVSSPSSTPLEAACILEGNHRTSRCVELGLDAARKS